ncbi:glycosyltransferase family 4 protein [Rhodovastum atsumiense]|uniref:Glycosyltransferase n=1 Tax=Rhodovastum atsumiense TaxID=504468 RepID=A0A5M6IPR2_9PROT|nr:glycosyltransferase family 1 protein [Rhodovastum atsumiense]KAA5609548.1 glycosyltransferase [Rhodovastum atsumiense]
MTRLWIDVEDLIVYALANARPSGIQRLTFDLYQALRSLYDASGQVGFVRHDALRGGFATVAWDEVAAMFTSLRAEAVPAPEPDIPATGGRPGLLRRALRPAVYRLPEEVRRPVILAGVAQAEALRQLGRAAQSGSRLLRRSLARDGTTQLRGLGPRPRQPLAELARPGDVLLALGASWTPEYAGLVAEAKAKLGLRFGVLLYDIIPLRRPEWCKGDLVGRFRAWFHGVLPLADVLLAISRHTAADVEDYAHRHGVTLRARVRPIPLGTGFVGQAAEGQAEAGSVRPDLPAPGSYVLFVSTIEARKNHALLVRVWRRLLEELPEGQVPTLVFAGRVGWLVGDLLEQLRNCDNLDGHVRIVADPTDAELLALYRGCRFTVFPSLYEGWGLPVTESLALGRPCVCSNATSLPEAGGELVRFFDPESVADATRVIRDTLQDRSRLQAWEAQVHGSFRPVPWTETARAVMDAASQASVPVHA